MDLEEPGSGGSTPVQDEPDYAAEDEEGGDYEEAGTPGSSSIGGAQSVDDGNDGSDNEQRTLNPNDDDYISDGGEVEREEVQQEIDEDEGEVEREEVEREVNDEDEDEEYHPGDGIMMNDQQDSDVGMEQSDDEGGHKSGSAPSSPAESGSIQSPPVSPMSVGSAHASPAGSGPLSPMGTGPRSPTSSGPESPVGSGPVSPVGNGPLSPTGSAPASPMGSGPVSPVGSSRNSPVGNSPRSPSGNASLGSPVGSGPASPAGSGHSSPADSDQHYSPSRGSGPASPTGSGPSPVESAQVYSPCGSGPVSPAGGSPVSPPGSPPYSPAGSPAGSPRSPGSAPGLPKSPHSAPGSPRSPGSDQGSPKSPGSAPGSPRSPDSAHVSGGGSPPGSPKSGRQDDSDKENDRRSDNEDERMGAGSDNEDERMGAGSDNERDESRAHHSDAESDRGHHSEEEKKRAKASDDEDSDKESVADELIADIFGSSDEDEEFEGFGEADVEALAKKKEKKKPTIKSDDEDDGEGGPVEVERQEGEVLPELTDDENEEAARRSAKEDFVSDFDLMMMKKKEESQARKNKKKDGDLINDNDDLIADMILKMKTAAEEDRDLNKRRQAATKKLKLLPFIMSQLKKADLHAIFLDSGILGVITEWLAPLPDKSLPHLMIRSSLLKTLWEFPAINSDSLKTSGVGKAVMYLYKHPKETRENKERAGKLINEWSRPIFNLTSNYKTLSREEREERDYEQIPKKRRISLEGSQTPRRDIDKALAGEDKALRPGDPGWVYRARVPAPSNRDYVVRPKTSVEYAGGKINSKKPPNRYEKHARSFADRKKFGKSQRAVPISIEGRNMAL